MYDFIRIFFTGLVISFLGALPLGTLNVTAMQIAIQENTQKAVRFALGVALVEILYVRISLKGMNWVMEHQQLFYILEWCTVVLFVVLALSSFITANRHSGEKNILLKNTMNRFLLGFSMSALNPVQIPFWFIWSTYLLSNKFLQPTEWQFNVYTAGIGVGTIIGLAIFIFAGKWVIHKLQASHRIIHLLVGVIFIISAVIQFYRVTYKPMDERLKEKPRVENGVPRLEP
jgi:threonine/homoserine/homoserine lactone efflux protein